VDGRFRISCILQACLHCSARTKIVVHDFFTRPYYFVVLPFLSVEKKEDTMGVFMIHKNNVKQMTALLKEYISIYEYLPGY